MYRYERADHSFISVSPKNSFDLSIQTGTLDGHLSVEEPDTFGADVPEEALNLVRTVMIAHLVARDFPKTIETNFPVTHPEFLNALYEYHSLENPVIKKDTDQVNLLQPKLIDVAQISVEAANAHSGGLDSAYRVAKLLEDGISVMATHLKNLNGKVNAAESEASRKQAEAWNIPLTEIRLINRSGNNGPGTMRTRDILLGVLSAVAAAPHGVSRVYIEGGMGTHPHEYQFSENSNVWKFVNDLVAQSGLHLEIMGIDPGDIETVGEILKLEQKLHLDIIPLIQNCFSSPYQKSSIRKKWARMTPVLFSASPEQWCGSCPKCRRMTLGRIAYKDPRLAAMPEEEIELFVRDTHKWMKDYLHNQNYHSKSFRAHLKQIGG